jgi:hypothetical protein
MTGMQSRHAAAESTSCYIIMVLTVLLQLQGGYRACNRMGIESSTSTFLKISFETAAHFLTDATMKGTTDDLTSPASRLVVGRVVEMGTGCFDLVQNLDIGDLAMQTA